MKRTDFVDLNKYINSTGLLVITGNEYVLNPFKMESNIIIHCPGINEFIPIESYERCVLNDECVTVLMKNFKTSCKIVRDKFKLLYVDENGTEMTYGNILVTRSEDIETRLMFLNNFISGITPVVVSDEEMEKIYANEIILKNITLNDESSPTIRIFKKLIPRIKAKDKLSIYAKKSTDEKSEWVLITIFIKQSTVFGDVFHRYSLIPPYSNIETTM